MAVYTHVDAAQVKTFLQDYDLGDYVSHEGITQGVENSNYHLFTSSGRYILTIFENRIDPKALPFVFAFIAHLKDAGLPVPGLVGGIGTLAGKAAAITEFLPGKDVLRRDITPDHCRQAGDMLARMHKAVENFGQSRPNQVGFEEWKRLLGAAYAYDASMVPTDITERIMNDYKALDVASLPKGAAHVDYFQDNVFFDEAGNLSGVIDFYFSCTESLIYDLAISVNCWCFDINNKPNTEKVKAFMDAYEKIRPLNDAERAAWPTIRAAAALRYFATRVYDWVFTPAGANVKKHDPAEYCAKMEAACPLP